MSAVEAAIPFRSSAAKCGERFGQTDYGAHEKISTNPQFRTSGINNIPRVTLEKRLFWQAPRGSRKNIKVWSEQKPASWTMDIASKFCKAGEPVADSCVSIHATSKTRLQLQHHRDFFGSAKYLMYFVESLPSLVEVFARQVLSPKFNMVGPRK